MDTLFGTLRQTREQLAQRGAKLAGATRERGLEALKKVRGGALDWRRTLQERRTELGERPQGWFTFAGLQLRVLDGVDRALAGLSERVRSEMTRLSRLELPDESSAGPSASKPTETAAHATSESAPEPATEDVQSEECADITADASAPTEASAELAPATDAQTEASSVSADQAAEASAPTAEPADRAAEPSAPTEASAEPADLATGGAVEASPGASASEAGAERAGDAAVTDETIASKPAKEPAAPKRAKRASAKGRASAKSKRTKRTSEPSSKRLVFPVADYDALSAKQVVSEIPRLSVAQCKAVHTFELANKKRKTVLEALQARIG